MDPEPIFINSTLTCNIALSITYIGGNIASVLEKKIAATYEGKCCEKGYVKPGSCKVVTHSNGKMEGTDLTGNVHYTVVFTAALFTTPASGTILSGKIENIVKAGLKIVSNTHNPSPFTVFIARDHNPSKLNTYKEGDIVKFRVRDSTFNLDNTTIYIIAELA